jgi:hypothetical protein
VALPQLIPQLLLDIIYAKALQHLVHSGGVVRRSISQPFNFQIF